MTDFSQSGCGGKRSNSNITRLRPFISHPHPPEQQLRILSEGHQRCALYYLVLARLCLLPAVDGLGLRREVYAELDYLLAAGEERFVVTFLLDLFQSSFGGFISL